MYQELNSFLVMWNLWTDLIMYLWDNTSKREIDGLIKLHSIQPISRMIVVTMEEENIVEKDGFHIELVPLWKWLLKF